LAKTNKQNLYLSPSVSILYHLWKVPNAFLWKKTTTKDSKKATTQC